MCVSAGNFLVNAATTRGPVHHGSLRSYPAVKCAEYGCERVFSFVLRSPPLYVYSNSWERSHRSSGDYLRAGSCKSAILESSKVKFQSSVREIHEYSCRERDKERAITGSLVTPGFFVNFSRELSFRDGEPFVREFPFFSKVSEIHEKRKLLKDFKIS